MERTIKKTLYTCLYVCVVKELGRKARDISYL